MWPHRPATIPSLIASPLHREKSTAMPSASDVAPPPSDEPVASPLHREISARPSNSVVAPPPSDEPTATPLQRVRDRIKEIHA
mmetsp:Transcript_42753/g.76917  ORF Transcript_42753/g.76917 Transcript_42753/m.76917 type:complete len:83 (-) Transcript_42753:1303-1551(-)